MSLFIAALALLLLVGWVRAQRLERATSAPGTTAAAAQVITSSFSYQGVLQESGGLVDGSREMIFTLYTDETCTTQVGDALTRTVPVNEGLFSVGLSFDAAHLNGQSLWLETEVEGTAVGCQLLQTTPYALSLRPGAIISGPVDSEAQLLHVRSGATSADEGVVGAQIGRRTSVGYPVGIYGYAYEFGAVGVWGVSDSPFGWGVNGIANGPDSIGVRGIASAFTSTTYGVYGEASSPAGYAGFFEHTAGSGDGVAFSAVGPTGGIITGTDGTGLSVSASGSTGGDDGLRGEHTNGDGVVGFSDGPDDLDNGVIGFTDGGYGVYGFSNAAGQYAGYFDGPIRAGSCTGCTLSYIARNSSKGTLQKGDVVQADGVEPQLAGEGQPVMRVTAAESSERVLGVVVGRTTMTMVEPGADDARPGPHYGPTGGEAAPGDYLVVVVQGMAQVRMDPAQGIQSGERIGLNPDGTTQAVDDAAFGMALEEADDEGLAWVLVGFD
jgi:hypothetical protein